MRICLAVPLLALILGAQVTTVDETTDRKMTRVGWFDRTGKAHQLGIQFGQPVWREEYDMRAKRPGRFRLGRDAWTTLHTNLELGAAGTEIAPGVWRLGLERNDEGAWSLLLFAVDNQTTAKTPAERIMRAKPDLRVPLRYAETDATAELLQIELDAVKDEPGHATLTVHWGGHQLQVAMRSELDLPPPVVVPKFELPDDAELQTTASGLRYQVVEKGSGAPAVAGDTVMAKYVLWREDGTLIDSSYGRADGPIGFPVDKVIPGMSEGFKLMPPGAIYRLVIPPKLGYGDKAPPTIGNNATLVFRVELVGVERK